MSQSDLSKFRPVALTLGICLALSGCVLDESNNNGGAGTVTPVALNDTGITRCADAESSSLACPVISHPGQDAESGQDYDNNDDSNGNAGFSFTKVGSEGQALPVSIESWDCVLDNNTNLLWEVKDEFFRNPDGSEPDAARNLRANTNTYTWYDPDRPAAEADQGVQNGGDCVGLNTCDTEAYIKEINRIALCGYRDWRLPSRAELRSIVDYSAVQPGPTIDRSYFPNASNPNSIHGIYSDGYWTFQTNARYHKYAWSVGFNTGGDSAINKTSPQPVRLVRGGQ